jgi:hypothetical protein
MSFFIFQISPGVGEVLYTSFGSLEKVKLQGRANIKRPWGHYDDVSWFMQSGQQKDMKQIEQLLRETTVAIVPEITNA